MQKVKDANILVVDDNHNNLRLMEQILRNLASHVRLAPSASLGLTSAQAEPPDLILVDIKMPDMDGYELCKRLKADPLTRDIPIIFISALQKAVDVAKAFSSGGVDFLSKPFREEEILARVGTQLKLIELQNRLDEKEAEIVALKERLGPDRKE